MHVISHDKPGTVAARPALVALLLCAWPAIAAVQAGLAARF